VKRPARIVAAIAAVAVLVVLVGVRSCGHAPSEREAQSPQVSQRAGSASREAHERSAGPRRAKPAPPLQKLALRGIVVDREEKPIADATVVLAIPPRVVRSGPDGRFVIAELWPGRYTVEARRGTQIGGPISVELDARTRDVTLRMYQGFELEVEVVAAETGRPIGNAEVEVALISMHHGAGRQRARTGADGIARLEGLTHIGHELRVSAAGFADERRGPNPDQLERAPWVRRIRIPLHRAATEIIGRLVDPRDVGIEGGEVEAVPYQLGDRAVDDARAAKRHGVIDPHAALRSGLGSRSDAKGGFRIGLETGTWVLIATAADHEMTVSEPIFIEAGGTARRELTLVMGQGRTVRGVVVDGADAEVAAAHVEARWLDGTRVLGSTVSDNGGGFELRGLPSAPIELVARDADTRSRPLRVDLVQGDVEGAVIALVLDGAITGRVVDDRGGGVADAVVTYLEQSPGASPSLYPDIAISDHEGRFKIAGIAPRVPYALSAARPQDGGFGQHVTSATARAGDNVTLTIPDGGAIVGRIVGAADPRQLVVRDMQTLTAARPRADGTFRLDRLPQLRYSLRINGSGIADAYIHDIDVAAGKDTDVGDITVKVGRRVAGMVVDTGGRPVDSARVRIEVDDRYAVVTRTSAGRFAVTVQGGAPLRLWASHMRAGRTDVLTLGATGSAAALRLAMQPGGTIQGVAKDHGRGVADAPVMVWPVGPRPTEPIAMAITDDAGAFSIPGVPPGRWLVELGIPAYEREHRVLQRGVEVAVGANVELELDISDAPKGTIVQPNPEQAEIPTYGEESDHDH
jgi:hypothetical protein